MFRYIESIRIEDGAPQNLEYHQERVNTVNHTLDLSEALQGKELPSSGLYKCRLVYGQKIESIEVQEYEKKEICTLRKVYGDIDYNRKFANRENLDALYDQRGSSDDILIIKNGWVTDSYYCNVAFLKEGNWYTPHRPLLAGTMRAKLLAEKKVIAWEIKEHDIVFFEKIALFNAMNDLGSWILPRESIL